MSTNQASVVTIALIGELGAGKTSLAKAILSLKTTFPATQDSGDEKLGSVKPRLQICDLSSGEDESRVKEFITQVARADAGVFVIAANGEIGERFRELVLLSRQVGLPCAAVYFSKFDLVTDQESVDLIEMEARDLLTRYGYEGDKIPVVRGSAVRSLESGLPSALSAKSNSVLVELLEEFARSVNRDITSPFLMSIERVNPAPTGTVIEGRIERGTIRTNAVVEIVGINPISRTTVTRIEIRDTEVSQAAAGEQVRIHVSLLDSKEVAVGAVVAAPGTLRLTLADYLSEVIENPTSRPASTGQIPSRKFDRETEKIATELVDEAIQSGILLRNAIVEPEEMSGGNTAEAVAKVTLRAPFVFKLDRYTQKLASEAKVMRKIGRNEYEPSLPKRFRDAWPTIYAIRDESPYAYLMEYFPKEQGWISLEDRLYPGDAERQLSAADALRFVNAVLDILFEGFGASVNNRNRPNLVEDYSGRIAQRMRDVAAADARFASKEIVVNGRHCRPWEEYLNILRRGWHFLNRITPSFMTVTHGDPNPGNLMLRVSLSEIELKLIDPKDWMTGDYLFDIAKITHFVSVTGPVEKPAQGKPKVQFKEGNPNTLVYEFEKPPWTDLFVEACLDRVGQFAEKHGDPYYKDRYKLGMAANLLGLPAARLKKGKEESALIMYGTGLTWLDKFCAGIPTN